MEREREKEGREITSENDWKGNRRVDLGLGEREEKEGKREGDKREKGKQV